MKETYGSGNLPTLMEKAPVYRYSSDLKEELKSDTGSPVLKKEKGTGQLIEQAESMNRMLELNYTNLKFNVHEELNRMYVQVLERDTEKVVREIPPKKFLDMIANMLQQIGILVDEKV